MRFLAALLVLLVAPAAHAAVFEIPLPELAGTYPDVSTPTGRSATFHLPGLPAVVHGVSLRLRGTTGVGIIRCPSGDHPWVTQTEGDMPAGVHELWSAGAFGPPAAGPFETIAPMEFISFSTPQVLPNWAFLDDGVGTILLSGGPAGTLLDCEDLDMPSLEVTEATLLVDADIPVPTAKTSWGRIKTIYR